MSRANQKTLIKKRLKDKIFFVHEEEEIQDLRNNTCNVILGKIVKEKPIHKDSIQTALSNI